MLRMVLVAALLLALAAASGTARAQALSAELAVSGLTAPIFLTAPPGDERLFVVERAGRIVVVEDGTPLATPFLDISSQVSTNGERGLLGMAFAPGYDSLGLFYVYYTNLAGDSVLSRFAVSADPNVAVPNEQVILTVDQPAANHNGGTVAFGPDGFLYLGLGDGGGQNDPAERAQDPGQLLGKMLRIDVGIPLAPGSLPVPGAPYGIPADNPFVSDPDTRDEIWALGLRNPYRFGFDAATGNLWIADVGQNAREEVNVEPAGSPGGRNYGWDVMEGSLCNPNDPAPAPPCDDPSLTLPVHEYAHTENNCSITGGYPYTATDAGPLWGRYFFGDFCTGRVWTYDIFDDSVVDRTAALSPAAGPDFELVSFGEDGFGDLYLVHQGGSIYRVVPPGQAPGGCGGGGMASALLAPLALWTTRLRRGRS